jgi:phospholipid-binding lipoprotein MlaA
MVSATLRDSVGMLGDQFLDPIWYVEPDELSIALSIESAANEGSLHLGEYEAFKAAAVDPYVAIRGAYIQYRQRQIQDQDRPTEPNSPLPPPRRPRGGVLQSPP